MKLLTYLAFGAVCTALILIIIGAIVGIAILTKSLLGFYGVAAFFFVLFAVSIAVDAYMDGLFD